MSNKIWLSIAVLMAPAPVALAQDYSDFIYEPGQDPTLEAVRDRRPISDPYRGQPHTPVEAISVDEHGDPFGSLDYRVQELEDRVRRHELIGD